LTLTAANHVVRVDRGWNPAVEDQATDRAFRIGQRRASRCEGASAPERSRRWSGESVVSRPALSVAASSGWTELSAGQLRELFRLENGSVIEW